MALTTKLPFSVGEYFALPKSDYVENVVLAADTAAAVRVPAGAKFVLVSSDASFWMAQFADITDAEAVAVPVASTTDGTGLELNPTMRAVTAGYWLGLISTPGGNLSLSFYT